MNKIPKQIVTKGIDPQVYLAAIEFHETAKEIAEKRRTKAEIVNYALSIELYLKCLQSTTISKLIEKPGYPEYDRKMTTIKGHKLYNDLFKSLTIRDQELLIELYKTKHSRDLILDLKEINNDFIDYRYAHERNFLSTSMTALKNIPELLKEYIESEMTKGNYGR